MSSDVGSRTVRNGDFRDIGVLVAATASIRLLIAALLPARALSEDFHIWQIVAADLMKGGNPYVDTRLLFYPPLWMQVLYFLAKVSAHTHVSLAHLIQVLLTGVDVVTVIVVYALLRKLGVGRSAFRIALIGIALNPISILMTCQHGNFDSIVGLLALATVFALVAWNRTAVVTNWLLACTMVGVGILAKTVPLIIAPLLLVRWRNTDWPSRILGGLLVAGPPLLAVSELYVLAPADTAADIFHYRSLAGWFGLSGLLNIVAGPGATSLYGSLFPALALVVVLAAAFVIARRPTITDSTLVLTSALLLAWVPPLGSGYGPQYIAWLVPLFVVLYAIATGALRASLIAFAVVAITTYLFEYGFAPRLGAFMSVVTPNVAAFVGQRIANPEAETLIGLPLFFSYLAVLVVGLRTLLHRGAPERWAVIDPATEAAAR